MTIPTEVERALAEARSRFGPLDAVIANVGSGEARGGFALSRDDWDVVLRQNLLAGMILAGAALDQLVSRGGGSFTFVSSIAGYEAINAPVTYSAAKAAVLSGMKSLSRLVGSKGVRVNAVAPGNTIFPGGSWERKLAEKPAFFEQYIQAEVSLQRFGRPEEIADAVLFLSSVRASFITGACLVIDGGQTRSI
jgi:3-oxoacyl-[acyl-carrier protein] reductase